MGTWQRKPIVLPKRLSGTKAVKYLLAYRVISFNLSLVCVGPTMTF